MKNNWSIVLVTTIKISKSTADLVIGMNWFFSLFLAAVVMHQPTESGQTVTLRTSTKGLDLQEFHSWTVELPAGPPVTVIHFDASMPAHGHGLATQPQIRPVGARTFQVEGVRFHMAGQWSLRVRFQDAGGTHSSTFPFEVSFASSALRSLWLGTRTAIRPDRTNRFADLPEAVALGKELFFDKRLSGDGSTACATCHRPETAFADSQRFSKPGVTRNAQGLLGVSEAAWLFWDGRRDSLWSQALSPMESAVEMGGSRQKIAQLLRSDRHYSEAYVRLTGAGPAAVAVDRLFADAGKFLAAFERTLQPASSRFDRYVEELESGAAGTALSGDEIAGLKIFLSNESRCMQCHNGPLFTNQGFHNIGTAALEGPKPDYGRAMGMLSLAYDAFNCRSVFSDARDKCASLDFARRDGHDGMLTGAFKVPSLRNVAVTAPYMHDGAMATLEQVIEHYRHPPKMASEIKPLVISDEQARQLAAFLRSLTDEGTRGR